MGVARHSFVWGAALLVTACAQDVRLDFPPESSAISSLLVMIDDDGPRAWAIQEQALSETVASGAAADVYLLQYPHELGALGLVEGPVELAPAFEGSQPLPITDRIRHQVVIGGQSGTPTALESWPTQLDDVRLPALAVVECVGGGGCLRPRITGDALVCKTPCVDPTVPELPVPPESVNLGPCPNGWLSTAPPSDDDIMECSPWATRAECEVGYAQRPGESSCTPIGEACPIGAWPENSPPGAVTYHVDAAATGFANGSQTAPFASLNAVPQTSTGTTVILVAAGDYTLPTNTPDPVHIVGRCVEQTRINRGLGALGGQITFQNLSLGPMTQVGGQLNLRGVEIRSSRASSVEVRGGRLVADNLHIRHLGSGPAIDVVGASEVEVMRAQFTNGGLRVTGAAEVRLRDSVVEGAITGIEVQAGANATASRVVVRSGRGVALRVTGEGAALNVEQVFTEAAPGGQSSVVVRQGARLSGRAVSIRGARGRGLYVNSGGTVTLEDLLVRDSHPTASLSLGSALDVSGNADVDLVRAHLVRSHTYGVLVDGGRTTLNLTDVHVIETRERLSDRELGTGIRIINDATVDTKRVRVTRTHGLGVEVRYGGQLRGSDLSVQDTLPRERDGAFGRGIEATANSSIELERLHVHAAHNIAIHILDEEATAVLRDLTITETRRSDCREFSCNTGIADGLTASVFANVDVERFLIDSNGQYGVRVLSGSRIALRDGTLSNNPVGAQIISGSYDLRLLSEGVRFVDNVLNFSLLTEP